MKALGFVGVLFLFWGCAAKVVKPPVEISAKEFWSDQKERHSQVSKISGKLSLHYENEQDSLSGKGRTVSDLGGKLRIELRDAFGRLHYDAVLSQKDFIALYPRQKLAYVDKKGGSDYLSAVVGIPLSFSDVQRLWVGLLPQSVVEQELKNWQWNPDTEQYEGIGKDIDGNRITIGVEASTRSLKELFIEMKNNKLHVQYSDFEPCCEKSSSSAVAHVAIIELLQGTKQSIEVEWNEISQIKQTSEDHFKIKIPEDVKKRPL